MYIEDSELHIKSLIIVKTFFNELVFTVPCPQVVPESLSKE